MFEHVRARIEKDIQEVKDLFKKVLLGKDFAKLNEEEQTARSEAVQQVFSRLNPELNPRNQDGRFYDLSSRRIYGTDKEARSARTAKNYFLFDIDESRLSGEFLALCLTTDYFQQQVKATGSTNYAAIRPHHVLTYKVPLSPLPDQLAIVEKHRFENAKGAAAEIRAREADLQMVRFLAESLGLNPRAEKAKLESATLHFARFASLERWGEIFHGPAEVQSGSKFPMVRLRDVIADLQNGWSPKCHDRPAGPDERGVLKLGAVSFGH